MDLETAITEFAVDKLTVSIYPDRRKMGEAAAAYVRGHLRQRLSNQDETRIVVGSAPSQDEFFDYLTASPGVDWSRVVVFHMDEYVGLAADHPQSFRSYQRKHFLSKVSVRTFHEIRGEASDIAAECERLSDLLAEKPIDLVCLGIGENGHLAFNDPPGMFDDPEWVRVIRLDPTSRQQQVNDGCFASIELVPHLAITLTLRVFREAAKLSGVVPGPTKARAVAATLDGPVSKDCPATLMRDHPDARLFLDVDSAALAAQSS